MYKKILLPVDLTDKHHAAVNAAAEFARQTGGSVTLLHVIELIPGLPREEDQAFYDKLEKAAVKHLDKIGKTLAAQQINWRPVVVFGHRLEETLRELASQKQDLVIVTSPIFDPTNAAVGWSSMSFKITVLAPAPVLVVKAQ
jgi:nucleotide-binding universal stress UspA family protein